MSEPSRQPPAELLAEAKRAPGGFVYEIEGHFNEGERVPPESIKGAWTVDDQGDLTGEYKANPNYRPRAQPE